MNPPQNSHPTPTFDALLPQQMAEKAESVGERKAAMAFSTTFALAVLAGAFIAWGAAFSTTAVAGAAGVLPFGLVRLLAELVFCLGLVLVVVGGAELFTGNNLIVMAWASSRISLVQVVRNWAIVFSGNLVGAMATAVVLLVGRQYELGEGAVGHAALQIAQTKCQLGFFQAVALGMGCNALVCIAVWLCFSAHSTTDKILAILFPIAAFVATGMEHSVANMYFIPMGLFIKASADGTFWSLLGATAADYASLTWRGFLLTNLLPVTMGNIIGGSVMVGGVYWFVYLRPRGHQVN